MGGIVARRPHSDRDSFGCSGKHLMLDEIAAEDDESSKKRRNVEKMAV